MAAMIKSAFGQYRRQTNRQCRSNTFRSNTRRWQMFHQASFRVWTCLGVAILFFCFALPVSAQIMEVRHALHHDVSPALRDMPPAIPEGELTREAEPWRMIPVPPSKPATDPDPVHQSVAGLAPVELSPTIGLSFDGLGNGTTGFSVCCAPPDTNGAVGATQYVQWVNLSFAIFDKTTGNIIGSPISGKTLWTGFGGPCEADNNGDPIVVYDKLAGRWVLSQFAVNGTPGNPPPPFLQCV